MPQVQHEESEFFCTLQVKWCLAASPITVARAVADRQIDRERASEHSQLVDIRRIGWGLIEYLELCSMGVVAAWQAP